ncbi:MAG: type III pantothenate kinase [Flavicella sp.]
MTNLIIDEGNTCIKIAVYESDTLKNLSVVSTDSLEEVLPTFFKSYFISNVILSSVGGLVEIIKDLIPLEIPLLLLSNQTKVPFDNLYTSPTTLGVDRIALVSAATERYPLKNVLIIDVGTCVTYDFINAQNKYLGGAIAPGILMRYKALSTFTAKLPKLSFEVPETIIGTNTQSSIHSGVVNGIQFEIDGFISAYQQKHSDLTVVLTGGDSIYLSKRLKNSIFAHPNFLLEGLNTILKYNIHE